MTPPTSPKTPKTAAMPSLRPLTLPHAAATSACTTTRSPDWLALAEYAYRFLRSRDSLRAIRVSIVPGTP